MVFAVWEMIMGLIPIAEQVQTRGLLPILITIMEIGGNIGTAAVLRLMAEALIVNQLLWVHPQLAALGVAVILLVVAHVQLLLWVRQPESSVCKSRFQVLVVLLFTLKP